VNRKNSLSIFSIIISVDISLATFCKNRFLIGEQNVQIGILCISSNGYVGYSDVNMKQFLCTSLPNFEL
jgi:hypothetical protein